MSAACTDQCEFDVILLLGYEKVNRGVLNNMGSNKESVIPAAGGCSSFCILGS